MKRIIFYLLMVLLLTGCGGKQREKVPTTVVTEAVTEPIIEPTTVPVTVPTEPPEERFLLTFVGDCTFGSNPVNKYALYSFENTIGENWAWPFANVLPYFESDDCTFVNLEGTLTETGPRIQKAHNFKGSPEYVKILTENSVEAVTLANNHSLDYGQEGYDNTCATLSAAGIPYAQTNQGMVFTTESGLSVGIYGTVYHSMGTWWPKSRP